MKKFSKILESLGEEAIDIKDILIDFKDAGFELDIKESHGVYTIVLQSEGTDENLTQLIEWLGVANERMKELGMKYDAGNISILGDSKSSKAEIKLQWRKEGAKASKDVHGWKEFKGYCEKVLGIDGMEGTQQSVYFRINVVDKDNGWPGLTDDMAGWSIDVEEEDKAAFVAQFPEYEAFLNKLLSRQISYKLVWHLVSEEGDRHHYMSDPAKLEEAKKAHNPMKFDREGIEAVETLLEMAEKFPGTIKIKKHKI